MPEGRSHKPAQGRPVVDPKNPTGAENIRGGSGPKNARYQGYFVAQAVPGDGPRPASFRIDVSWSPDMAAVAAAFRE